jgi:hypothetical protein
MNIRFVLAAALCGMVGGQALAQVTPAAGYTPPDDTPKTSVGATIFGDYTWQQSPEASDADGNKIHASSFNVSRAYVNVTGSLNHRLAFRVTPDVARETGSGSSLSGSQTFRLKYAYGQFNLDDWTTHGSWVRFGVQQTPYIDYTEGIYRYRFQGTVFAERIGLLTSSDPGLSAHYNFPGNYGDLHAGFYNGEGYSKVETNNEKAVQVRASLRPMPLGGIWKGLRLTAFVDEDHYVQSAPRTRLLGQITFEHPLANAGFEVARGKDETSATKPEVQSKGWSLWVTPRFGHGWEALLRHDDFRPDDNVSSKTKRDIAGLAYWIPNLNKVTTALMVDYDALTSHDFTPVRPKDTRYGLKMLINF